MKHLERADNENQGSTVVISHRVKAEHVNDYEEWLNEIAPLCRSSAGFRDWQIVRPLKGFHGTYTIIIRFDDLVNLKSWMYSETRKDLIKRVIHFLQDDDRFHIRTGMDYWFMPEEMKARIPVAWKQYLLTWSAIFPISLLVQLTVVNGLHRIGLPVCRVTDTLILSGVVVLLMVYVVMPRYTKLVKQWLFR